jgi:hypothetical protein
MLKMKKWQPRETYFVGDMLEAPEDTKQVALFNGHTGNVEPLWKRKRGQYTDDHEIRWKCGGKVNGVENEK